MSSLGAEHRDFLRRPLREFVFPAKVHSVLKNDGIETLEDLVKMTPQELLRIPNFGRRSVRGVQECLLDIGLRLAGDRDNRIDSQPALDQVSAARTSPMGVSVEHALARIADALERIAGAIGKDRA